MTSIFIEFSAAPFEANARLARPVYGGETRQASVRLGLEALAEQKSNPKIVLIHDAARLFVSDTLVDLAIAAAKTYGAAIPGVTLSDTIKETDAKGFVTSTPPRARLRAVQTPQAFRFDLILAAHRNAATMGALDLTDDAAVAEWAGHPVHIFAGEDLNLKVTTSKDSLSPRRGCSAIWPISEPGKAMMCMRSDRATMSGSAGTK